MFGKKSEDEKNNHNGFFSNKEYISEEEFRRKMRNFFPKDYELRSHFDSEKRKEISKDLFGKGYGSYLTKSEYRKRIRELERKKTYSKSVDEKIEIRRKIKLLKEFFGF